MPRIMKYICHCKSFFYTFNPTYYSSSSVYTYYNYNSHILILVSLFHSNTFVSFIHLSFCLFHTPFFTFLLSSKQNYYNIFLNNIISVCKNGIIFLCLFLIEILRSSGNPVGTGLKSSQRITSIRDNIY